MKIRNIVLFIIILLQLSLLKIWLSCLRFNDYFQFSPIDGQLKTDDAIRNDVGYSTLLVRFFHNKMWTDLTEILNRYFHFWNTNFDLLFFSLIGDFGIFYALYYLMTQQKKSRKIWFLLTILFLLPFVLVLHNSLSFILRLFLLTIPYYIFSLYGLGTFMHEHKRKGVYFIIVLLFVSIWYLFAFQKDIFIQFCYNK